MPRYDAAGLMGSARIAERIAGLALAGLVVAACSSGGSAPPTQAIATTKRYELTFDVEMLDDGTLDVVANHTNLPEGTVVEVSATRSFVDAKGGLPDGRPGGSGIHRGGHGRLGGHGHPRRERSPSLARRPTMRSKPCRR